eukprot:gene19918-25878_t
MGVVLTTAAPLDDYRVKKCMKTFDIPTDKIQILWNLFNRYDRERSESMLDLIDSRSQEHLNFGEFVDIICTFACFEQTDLIRFCFYALDNTKVGSVEKNEVKHFVYDMWENRVTSNIHTGLAYLDEHDDVKARMGIAWYLLPWMRKIIRSKVAKIAAINNELDEIENDDIAKQYLTQKK